MHSRSILLAAASFSAISTAAWADALPQSGPAATRLEDVVVTADALGVDCRGCVDVRAGVEECANDFDVAREGGAGQRNAAFGQDAIRIQPRGE